MCTGPTSLRAWRVRACIALRQKLLLSYSANLSFPSSSHRPVFLPLHCPTEHNFVSDNDGLRTRVEYCNLWGERRVMLSYNGKVVVPDPRHAIRTILLPVTEFLGILNLGTNSCGAPSSSSFYPLIPRQDTVNLPRRNEHHPPVVGRTLFTLGRQPVRTRCLAAMP